MNQNLQITNSLPPLFDQLSQFEYGKLIIQLNIQQLNQLNIKQFQFEFLGAKSVLYKCNILKKIIQYPIKTTLWHFYQYLKDMNSIKVILQQRNNQQNQSLTCIKQLDLISINKVINKNYLKGNYIANSVQLCDIFNQNNQNKGYVMFKVKLQFNQDIHKQIKDVVDFQKLINNPEENNHQQPKFIQLTTILQNDKNLMINSKQTKYPHQQINYQNIQNLPNLSNQIPIQYSEVKHIEEDQSRMIEDDIDKLIAQMQNKPYDSSRYLDNTSNSNNFVNPIPPLNNFVNTQPHPSNMNPNSFHSIGTIPNDSRMNRFQQQNFNQSYHQGLNHSQQNSKSPNMRNKYPPIPLPNNRNFNQTQQFIGNQTIYTQSQRSLSPMNSRNRSFNKTQQSNYQNHQSMRNIPYNQSGLSMTGLNPHQHNSNNKGTLKIQIHELLGKQLDINDCMLRVFVNNDYEDIINCKGFQQGQVIVYNQKAELNECQLCDIQKLRFQLQNWEGNVLYSSNFQLSRLVNIPKLEGIFMLNLHPHQQQYYGNQLTASQTVLKKLQKPPSQKSLRITVAFSQQIEVIQLYLNLSKFSLNFNKCKYKIPFTKQTVQFQQTQSHFNIFPHNKIYTKLMIQFWDDKAILGISEINLSNLKNITKNVLQCNLQPIYLYDTIFPIKNIFNQNQVGKFKLLVCCGNVRQVQHVLNKSMLNRTSSLTQMSNSNVSKSPVQVQYDKKLGVFIKDRKVKQQIQIQVDQKQLSDNNINHKQTQQKQNYHEVSMLSQNQFLSNNKPDITLSKVHSIKLSQQQQFDSDEQQNEIKNKPSPKFNKKFSSQLQKQKQQKQKQKQTKCQNIQLKPMSIQVSKPQPKSFINLQTIICTNLKNSFLPLAQNNFQCFQQLKKSCKPHLLFNFIDIDILIKNIMELGISKFFIEQILQILQPLNGMVNFNLLNDFMMSLEVQGEIKYNLVPNKLFVRLALQEYYRLSCEQIQRQQTEMNQNHEYDQKQWLSNKYLSQISTLDQSVDFNEIRKLFNQLSIKISMNEYNFLKNFLQNEKQIRNFLFELAQSKSSYESMIKSQKNIYEILKLTIIEEIIKKKKQKKFSKKYEQSILDKLYNSKIYSENLNDSKIQHNNQSLYQSRASQIYSQKTEFVQTKKNYPVKNKYEAKEQQNHSFASKNNKIQHQYEDDQDDFIINSLNIKNQPKRDIKQQSKYEQTKRTFSKKIDVQDQQSNAQIINTKRFKQQAPSIQFSKTGQTVMNYGQKRTITITGLQDCKTTCECQLDMELQSPYLKIVIQNPYQKKLYFKQSDSSSSQQFQVKSGDPNDDQQIEGKIFLVDVTQKGQLEIAIARFVAIKGIQSVYALKTIQQQIFCGLIKITIE